MPINVTLETALTLLMQSCAPLPEQTEPTGRALGRPLTRDAFARWDLPPFDRARCAGYALRAADLHRANHKRPAVLEVLGFVPAGSPATFTVGAGQAVAVEVGAPLPCGCDCVVPLRDTDGGETSVNVFCQLWPFDNIERQGSLVPQGALLCPAGTAPDAARTALLRCAGVEEVIVRPTARLALLTLGRELTDRTDAPLPPACVGDFDLLYLTECWGSAVEGTVGGHCLPEQDALLPKCKELLSMDFPLLLVCGGFEAAWETLTQLGAEALFCGVKLRHGERVAALKYRSTHILLLPGDPFAAGTISQLFVRSLLGLLSEDATLLPRREKVRLCNAPAQARPQRRLLPVTLREGQAVLTDPEGESMLSLQGMQALLDLPAGEHAQVGDLVSVFLWDTV